MGSSLSFTMGVAAATVATAALTAALVVACSSDTPKPSGAGTGAGVACLTGPGEIPASDCDDSSNECTGSGCAIDEAKCGTKATCLPMADNTGKQVWDLRIRKLNVVAPRVLAEHFVQNIIVGRNIDLNAPACADRGTGSFTWLLRIDRTKNMLVTGGAPPSDDPFGVGYCFANDKTTNGIAFGPATVPIKIDGNKVAPTITVPKLNIPVYVDGNIDNVILLPISNGSFRDVTLSDDGNCIGGFDSRALNSECDELRGACTKWKTAGALGGYITLAEADDVVLKDLENRTLCGFLTGNTTEKGCHRGADGKIDAKGDFCSQTNAAGGCADAYWLAATFSAAAVKIHDGSTIKACNGGGTAVPGPGDAGTD